MPLRPSVHTTLAVVELRRRPLLHCLRALLPAGLLACAGMSAAGDEGSVDKGLADQIRSHLGAAVVLPAGPARVELEVGRLDPRLKLAPCRRIETKLPPAAQLWGRTRVVLRCAEGERHWQVYLPVTVRVYAPAPVARGAIAAGTVITAAMLGQAEVDWAAEAAPPIADAAALVGRTVARATAAGAPLRGADLRQRQFFAAGDTVVLWARGDGFTVSGEGQALTAGVEGQPVRVRTDSGRVLTGMPVAGRRVEVQL